MYLLQVLTVRQNAIRMVGMYPNMLTSTIYEALAESREEPSTSYLMSQETDYNKGLTWGDAVTYVNNITYENLLVHVPFCPLWRQSLKCLLSG